MMIEIISILKTHLCHLVVHLLFFGGVVGFGLRRRLHSIVVGRGHGGGTGCWLNDLKFNLILNSFNLNLKFQLQSIASTVRGFFIP